MLSKPSPVRASAHPRFWGLLIGFAALLALLPAPVRAQEPLSADDRPVYVPGRLLVGVAPDAAPLQAASALQALDADVVQADDPCVAADLTTAQATGAVAVQTWQVPPGQEDAASELLRREPGIVFVERDVYMYAAKEPRQDAALPDAAGGAGSAAEQVTIFADNGNSDELDQAAEAAYSVNDPLYLTHQWGPQRANFPRAWQLIPNPNALTTIRVSVIDSGVDFNHPDLALRLTPGKNYLNPTALPQDDNGHGTHVAGIIAATTNNGVGIAGSAPKVLIDPRKVLGADGGGSAINLRYAICDAARSGSRVINMSVQIPPSNMPPGSPLYTTLKEAMDFAEARGVVLVAAGGNSRANPQVYYPALFDEVIAVAASDVNNARAGYSAIGSKVELIAPGGESPDPVWSTWPSAAAVRNECTRYGAPLLQSGSAWYCGEYGTSMASPYVAGAAALVWSINPNLSAARVRTLLTETATDLGLPANQQGAGLLNAEAAVRRLLPSSLVATPSGDGRSVAQGSAPYTTTIVLSNPSLDPLTLMGVTAGGGGWLSISNSGSPTVTGSIRHGQPLVLSAVVSPTNLAPGTYNARIQLNATRTDGTGIARALTVFVAVGVNRPPLYLPMIVQNTAPQQSAAPGAAFTWETAVSPTVHALGTSGSTAVFLPFAFPLGGPPGSETLSYGSARIYADGFLTFPAGDFTTIENPGSNRCLPLVDFDPLQGVFGWWADLDPSVPGAQVSSFRPSGGLDRFVVEYKDVAAVGTPGYRVSFQIVLYASGDIQLNYQQVPPAWAATLTDYRPIATVGAQAQNGVFRNQIACQIATIRQGALPQSGQSLRLKAGDLY